MTDLLTPTLAPWLVVAALAVIGLVAWRRPQWLAPVLAALGALTMLLGRRRPSDRNAEIDRQRDDRVREAEAREAREVERARVQREADDARTREAEAEARRVREAGLDEWLNGPRRGP